MGEGKGIGLVLAGGGGKGAYQVGVLKVLQEQGLLEDVTAISGASIGAVNAMLYSMNDMERMYQAWNEIDMDTVFDIDLNMLAEKRMYFSRNEMLAMFEKYIDMEKIKADFRDIYVSISRLNETQQPEQVEYRRLEDYDADTIRKILLASTALPVMYEAVEIDGKKYRDGGLLDNEPIFTGRAKEFRQMLGEKDALRALKTKFHPDDLYIRMEPVLAQNDYNDIMMQLRVNHTYKTMENRVNSNIEKFNNIAKKYENL